MYLGRMVTIKAEGLFEISFDIDKYEELKTAVSRVLVAVDTLIVKTIYVIIGDECPEDTLERFKEELNLQREQIDRMFILKEQDYCYNEIELSQSEKEYRPYRDKLHPYNKRRCFKQKIHWKRTRSNPR